MLRKFRPVRLAVLLVLAITAAAGIGAVLANSPAGNTIYGAIQKNNGMLRIINSPSEVRNSETLISWNKEGPQGPQGPAGPQGPPGPAGRDDGWTVKVLTGKNTELSGGESVTLDLFTLTPDSAALIEVAAVAVDSYNVGQYLAFQGTGYSWLSSDGGPLWVWELEPLYALNFGIESPLLIASGNTVQLLLQNQYASSWEYKIIAKWFIVPSQ